MEDFLKQKMISSNNGGHIIPHNVKDNLTKLGDNAGQKYSNLVDKIVDLIFKK